MFIIFTIAPSKTVIGCAIKASVNVKGESQYIQNAIRTYDDNIFVLIVLNAFFIGEGLQTHCGQRF